jgi:hypothetical protein
MWNRSGIGGDVMLKKSLPVAVIVGMLALAGCARDKVGSGVEKSDIRRVGAFRSISLAAEIDVVVSVGEKRSVIVRGDGNLIGDVGTAVDGKKLEISQPENIDFEPKVGLGVEVSLPDLAAVEVSGAGEMRVEGVERDSFRADVSGAGNLRASGNVGRVEIDVSGAGDADFDALIARDVSVDVSGAGDVVVHATESLAASVSGAGDVTYSGDPEEVQTDISGAGDVDPG